MVERARQPLRRHPRSARPRRRLQPPAFTQWASVGLTFVAAVAGFWATLGLGDEEFGSGGYSCRNLTERSDADANAATTQASHDRVRVQDGVRVGERPVSLAVGSDGVWVAHRGGLSLIDPATNEEIGFPTPLGGRPSSVAVARDRVWVTRNDGQVVGVDRRTRQVVTRFRYGRTGGNIALGGGAIWINNFDEGRSGTITRIDPCEGERTRIAVGLQAATVQFGYDSVWVTDPASGSVVRVDARKKRREAIIRGFSDPTELTVARDGVWVVEWGLQRVARIDPSTNSVSERRFRVAEDPAGIARSRDSLWVPSYSAGTLSRIDPRTGRASPSVARVGEGPTDIAVGFGRLWIPNNDGTTVTPVVP